MWRSQTQGRGGNRRRIAFLRKVSRQAPATAAGPPIEERPASTGVDWIVFQIPSRQVFVVLRSVVPATALRRQGPAFGGAEPKGSGLNPGIFSGSPEISSNCL